MAWIFKPGKIKVSLISGHANLFKTISIPFFACSLIFKSLKKIFPIITGHSAIVTGRKPLKIRLLQCLGGTFFEISSWKDRHNLWYEKIICHHFWTVPTLYRCPGTNQNPLSSLMMWKLDGGFWRRSPWQKAIIFLNLYVFKNINFV